MFNQSISKFSSSKLSLAISAAIFGLSFSTSVGASHVLIDDTQYANKNYVLPNTITVKDTWFGLRNNVENVTITGGEVGITNEEGYPKNTRNLYGFYNTKQAAISVDAIDIQLDSFHQTTYGIRTQKALVIDAPSVKISLSNEKDGLKIVNFQGVAAVGSSSAAIFHSDDIDIQLDVGEKVESGSRMAVAGIFNQGTTQIEGADVFRVKTNLNSSFTNGSVYALHNFDSAEMVIDANLTELELNVGKNAKFAGSLVPLAAVYSEGSLVMSGEALRINLADSAEPNKNRIIHGIKVWSGTTQISTESLEIEGQTSGSYIYGILSQNKGSNVVLNSKTTINVTSEGKEGGYDPKLKGNSYGLLAFAGGELTVNGDIEVHANKAIAIRGSGTDENAKVSKITVNRNGDKSVKLYGDIDFNLADSNKDSQNVEKAEVVVNLVGPESIWEGHTTITADTKTAGGESAVTHAFREDGLELTVTLKDNARWIPNASNETVKIDDAPLYTEVLPLKTLVLDNGVIELTDKSGSEVKVATLKGSGGEVHTQVTIDGNSIITSNKFSIKRTEGTPSLAVHAKGITADDVKDRQAAMESFYANALFLDKEATVNTQLHIPEGEVAGKLRATVDSEDNVTVQEDPHTISSSVLSIASSNYLSFRSQINDVASRLGDLRSMPKTAGAWVRYYGGQNKYSDRGMKEDYNTIQIGGDGFIADKYYLGGTFSYTDGNGTLVNGSSDDKNYNFGIYGGWLGEKGQFVDVIVKRHRIKSDFDLFNALGKSSGSYRTWGTSASIEAGWRLQCPANGFYAEPQAEFMLGHVESVNYKTNRGVRIHQDGINSAIGRVGVAFGYTFPENKGNAYAKASVLHDWKGDVKASYSKDGVSRRMHDDLGGTWGEFAVGATYNPIKNLSAYGQFKTTTGSPIRTPWQASIGVRYSF